MHHRPELLRHLRLNCLKNGILPISLEGGAVEEFEQLVVAVDGKEPVTVDLEHKTIAVSGKTFSFSIAEGERQALLKGLDDIGYTLEYSEAISAFEEKERVLRSPGFSNSQFTEKTVHREDGGV